MRRVLLVVACLLALYVAVEASTEARDVVDMTHTEVSTLQTNVADVAKPKKKAPIKLTAIAKKRRAIKKKIGKIAGLISKAKKTLLKSTKAKINQAKKDLKRLKRASRKRRFKKPKRYGKHWTSFRASEKFRDVCWRWTRKNSRSVKRRCSGKLRVYAPKPMRVRKKTRVHCSDKHWTRRTNAWKCMKVVTLVIPFTPRERKKYTRLMNKRFFDKIQRKIHEKIANSPHISKAALATKYAAAKMALRRMHALLARQRAMCAKKIAACRAKLGNPKLNKRHNKYKKKHKQLKKVLKKLKKRYKRQKKD